MFITIGKLKKKMLISLLIPIFYIIRHVLLEKIEGNKNNIFINTFIFSVSSSINVIPLIIEYNSIKSKNRLIIENIFNNQLLIEKRKLEKNTTKKRILYLILISIINFLNYQLYDFIKVYNPI